MAMQVASTTATVTGTDSETSTGFGTRFATVLKQGGLLYAGMYFGRAVVDRMRDRLDYSLAAIEQRRNLVGPWTISARRFTAAENRALWNNYDWSSLGEEWTKSAEWKDRVVNEFLVPNIAEGGVVVEVGPGGGRWTDILRRRARKLFVVDVSDKALGLCRERFRDSSNIDYLLSDGRTIAVPDASVDAVWSYDVFVHINPMDTRGYFAEFRRILKPGGRAVVHHPGPPLAGDRVGAWRSDLTDAMVADFCRENGLRIIDRTTKYVNEGDVASVIEKPR
jgi:ubiquinone/menaquinone biosynthesis C-methylase UbiE